MTIRARECDAEGCQVLLKLKKHIITGSKSADKEDCLGAVCEDERDR